MPAPAQMAAVVPEVGGGDAVPADRRITASEANYHVDTPDAFTSALDDVGDGGTIYVADDAELDLTGETKIQPGADNVTIASGRGHRGMGALLRVRDPQRYLFRIRADGVRFTGLRLQGPRTDYFDPREQPGNPEDYYASAIHFLGDDWEVDNCELYGWPFAAIESGAKSYPVSGHAHHNHIHHCQMETLGYGAELYNGATLWEYNRFDATRHAIAGFGHEKNSYEARFNLVGPRTVSHAFDMHGLRESTGHDGNLAGESVDIHHNTVMFIRDIRDRKQEAVAIRGVPAEQSRVANNWFLHAVAPTAPGQQGSAVRQGTVKNWTRLAVADNHYGVSMPPRHDIGCPRLHGMAADDVERLVDERVPREVRKTIREAFSDES